MSAVKRPDTALRNKKNAKHGMSYTPEWSSYKNARNRCNNPNNKNYKYYGGRGIEFRFKDFNEFFNHIGSRPVGTSLDRIKTEGHYETGNVKWSTPQQQVDNRRKCTTIDQFTTDELLDELDRRGAIL